MEKEQQLKEISNFILSFGLIMPRVFAVISITTTSVGIFLIVAKSPKSMATYKYVLLMMMMVSFQFDMVLSVLAGPIPLPGANGLQFIGFLAEMFPSEGNVLVFLMILTFYMEVTAILLGFLYREYILLRIHEKPRDNIRRFLNTAPILIYSYVLTPFLFRGIITAENETRDYLTNKLKQKLFVGAAVWLFHPTKMPAMSLMSGTALIMLVILFFHIKGSIKKINRFLLENSVTLSDRSVRLQRMLLRALIFQSAIPFMFLMIPCIILYSMVFVIPLFLTVSNDFAQHITAVVYSTPALYSPARVSCMIYFTTPYKEYIVKLLRLKPKATLIIPVTEVIVHSVDSKS